MPSIRGKRGILSDEEPKEKRLITHHFRTMRSASAAPGKAHGKAQHKSAAVPKTPAAKDRPTPAKPKAAESAGVPKALEARASARLAKTTIAKPGCKAAAAKAALPGTKSKGMPAQAASPAKKPRLAPQKVCCCCSCSTAQMLTHAVHYPRPVWCAMQQEAATAPCTVSAGSYPYTLCSSTLAGWALATALLTDCCKPHTP